WPELAEDPGFSSGQNASYNLSANVYRDIPLSSDIDLPAMLVIGNSFARDFVNMAVETGLSESVQISYHRMDSVCGSISDIGSANAAIADLIVIATDEVLKALHCIEEKISTLEETSSGKVVVLGNKNFGWNNNAIMLLPDDRRYTFRTKPISSEVY